MANVPPVDVDRLRELHTTYYRGGDAESQAIRALAINRQLSAPSPCALGQSVLYLYPQGGHFALTGTWRNLMTTYSKSEARKLYTVGNNRGLGYAPYTDVAGDDTVENAIAAAEADGWELVHSRDTSDEVAVLENEDGEVMAIGGDGAGNGAWAVIISDV